MSRTRVFVSSLVVTCLWTMAACGDGDDGNLATESTTSGPGLAGAPTVKLESVADLGGASGVADPSGSGPVLVSALTGEIFEVDLATGSSEVVLDLGQSISTGGEQGLLDIAIDPGSGRLVANLTNLSGDTEIRSWPVDDGRPVGDADDGVLHLRIGQPLDNHNGGNLEFGPDGHLWIGTGDGGGGGDPDDRAQNPDDLLGKMLRVDLDPAGGLTVPADNPGGGSPGEAAVWAIGLRNPWRYSFDPDTGLLWIADVGQNEIEEVSVIDPGSVAADDAYPNFGWNLVEGNADFEGSVPDDHVTPAIVYRHDETGGCSITGGHVYRGAAVEALRGWYLFGDFCGGWLRAVPADSPSSEPVEVAADVGQILSIEVLENGEILVLTADGILALTA